jgi:hypothetical protein
MVKVKFRIGIHFWKMIFICVRVTYFQFLGGRSETFPKFSPCVRYPSNYDERNPNIAILQI